METDTQNPIRAYRQAKGLTLEQFGALVGVQKAAVSKWEDGRPPSFSKAIEIEQVTGGDLPRHVLRPDIWGDMAGKLPISQGDAA